MKVQRTSIGLDVHARSVVGCALDGDTGEVFQRRLTPDHREIREWLTDLPAPVAVTYEAGPTGFGLARALIGAGIDCRVAAPSKLQRPAGDRVKTDARDAAHLARLLHLGQIVEVRIPTVAQEAARDLVRAREDCRGDVMTSRHRISKLLLRQGIVYYGGRAWTGKHEMWLRAQRFDSPALMLAYESALDAMVAGVHRRDRLDEAITAMAADSEFTPVVTRLGCLRGVSTLTAFGLAVEIGDWHRVVMQAGSDKAGVVRHINEQLRAAVACDLGKRVMWDLARVSTRAGDDELGLMLTSQLGDLVEVDAVGVPRDAVAMEVIQLAADV